VREILFRGKRIDNGEWVEGFYMSLGGKYHYILVGKLDITCGYPDLIKFHVDPETVGQYTELKDENGNKIFEGDIVAQSWYDFDEPADDCFGEVLYFEGDCSFSVLDLNKNEVMSMGQGCYYHWEAEVIGNIYDNPELMEGK
jgi:uncharacterized phage protein (TIGR01671 family)